MTDTSQPGTGGSEAGGGKGVRNRDYVIPHLSGQPYNITKLSELHPSLVVEAELESTLGHVGVHAEVDQVVLQKLQHVAVGLPQELDPRGKQNTVRSLLRTLSTHCAQQ